MGDYLEERRATECGGNKPPRAAKAAATATGEHSKLATLLKRARRYSRCLVTSLQSNSQTKTEKARRYQPKESVVGASPLLFSGVLCRLSDQRATQPPQKAARIARLSMLAQVRTNVDAVEWQQCRPSTKTSATASARPVSGTLCLSLTSPSTAGAEEVDALDHVEQAHDDVDEQADPPGVSAGGLTLQSLVARAAKGDFDAAAALQHAPDDNAERQVLIAAMHSVDSADIRSVTGLFMVANASGARTTL